MQNVERKIEELKTIVMCLKVDTPRLTRNEAKKFLAIGEDKFRVLKRIGLIKERIDHWGAKYYLRHELLKVLEDDSPLIKKRQLVK